jgi:PKD repeat protein
LIPQFPSPTRETAPPSSPLRLSGPLARKSRSHTNGTARQTGQPGTTTMMSTLDPNEQFICQYLADGPDPADPRSADSPYHTKVKDRLGQEDSSTIDFPIKDRDDPRLPPNAVATASASSGEVPFTVSFNSDQSSAPSVSIQSYEWDFGDGSEVSKLPNPTHVFQDTIPRTITLTVTDDAGLTGPAYLQFTGTVIGTLPPKAEFPAPTTFFKPAVVKFDGSSSVSYDGPLTYSWDFGDGKPVETSATPVISHNFTDSGSFTVTLTVKDIGGRTGFRTRTVEVKPLSPPKGFQATGGNPWLLLNTSWIDFAWINPTRAQGEELVVDIEIPPPPAGVRYTREAEYRPRQGLRRIASFRVAATSISVPSSRIHLEPERERRSRMEQSNMVIIRLWKLDARWVVCGIRR